MQMQGRQAAAVRAYHGEEEGACVVLVVCVRVGCYAALSVLVCDRLSAWPRSSALVTVRQREARAAVLREALWSLPKLLVRATHRRATSSTASSKEEQRDEQGEEQQEGEQEDEQESEVAGACCVAWAGLTTALR